MSSEFGARLAFAHVTAGVKFWGPGGSDVNQEWKAAAFAGTSQGMAEVEQGTNIKADVFVDSDNVARELSQTPKQPKADLLVTACQPYGGYLRAPG